MTGYKVGACGAESVGVGWKQMDLGDLLPMDAKVFAQVGWEASTAEILLFRFFYYYSFEMWGRMTFYLPERNRERWLPSPTGCKHKMHPHYPCAHKSQVCLGMESSGQAQIPVSSYFPFAAPQVCFPVHLQNFATDLVISMETSSLLLTLPNVTESVFVLPHQTRATFCCWHIVAALLQLVTARVS